MTDVRKIAHGLFDQGYPFVDSDGTKYYGEEAKKRFGSIHLAGEPWGVWNVPGKVLWLDLRGMPVTVVHQRLNAAEELVESCWPTAARAIRVSFDWLEAKARRNRRGLLWRSGRVVFPILGWLALLLLVIAGQRGRPAEQYV